MKMKKFISMILAGAMALSFAGCGKAPVQTEKQEPAKSTEAAAKSDYEYITDKGKLVVGITEYEPMDFKDESGNWTGFDAEFAENVGELMGVDIEFVVIDWDNKFFELDSKAIDCIWNGMTITDEVLSNTACSKPYVKNQQVVVMPADKLELYKDAESMKGLVFAVESGSAGESAAEEAGFETVAVAAQSDTLTEVASGSADACIIDETMAVAMTGEGTSYADLAAGITLTKEEYGVGFRKGSDMVDKFNEYMKQLKENGVLEALADKYELSLAD